MKPSDWDKKKFHKKVEPSIEGKNIWKCIKKGFQWLKEKRLYLVFKNVEPAVETIDKFHKTN